MKKKYQKLQFIGKKLQHNFELEQRDSRIVKRDEVECAM